MKNKKYDVFISYRREGGFEMADSIYQRLKNAGYAVFFDLEQLNAGKFNTKLLAVIEQCQDFIIVLPPHALDRCKDEDDWVRQEVEHAMKLGKNIIPIMLRGFEWPEPKTLPESLRDLQNYNGISASDHNVFSENIERLKKSFIRSRAGFNWRRYKTLIISISVALLILLAAIFTWVHFDYKKYEQVCKEQSTAIMSDFAILHNNLGVAEDVLEAWEEYYDNYTPKDSTILRKELTNTIHALRKTLREPSTYSLSEEQKTILRRYEFPIEELEAFPIVTKMYQESVHSYLDDMIGYAHSRISKINHDNAQLGFEFLLHSLKANYYAILSIFSIMPPVIYDNVLLVVPTLTYMPDIQVTLSQENYEAAQRAALNEVNDVVLKMGGNVHNFGKTVEELEEEYQDKQTQYKAELIKLEKEVAALYKQALKTFALQSTDDQGIMWGKILRLALFAEDKMKDDQEFRQLILSDPEEAGLDLDDLENIQQITYHDMYKNVDIWLQQYEQYNPANETHISNYVNAARAYFKAVEEGKQNPRVGAILVATKDNVQHPVYQIGDIIVKKNGKIIRTVADFFTPSDVTEHNVKVLRLVNGELKQIELSYPADCSVLVGLSPLSEEKE